MRTLSLLGLDAAERPRLNAASLRRLARLGTVVRWPGLLFAAILSLAVRPISPIGLALVLIWVASYNAWGMIAISRADDESILRIGRALTLLDTLSYFLVLFVFGGVGASTSIYAAYILLIVWMVAYDGAEGAMLGVGIFVVGMITHSLLAAEADSKSDVQQAIRKLSGKPNYSWTSTPKTEGAGQNWRQGPTEGKTEKGGYTYAAFTFNDTEVELAFHGDKSAIKRSGEWESADELEGGNNAWIGRRLKAFKPPAGEAEDLLGKAKSLKKEDGGIYSGGLTEEGVKELFSRIAAEFNPDLVVVKENEGHLRGREPGEVPRIIRTALLRAGLPESAVPLRMTEVEAARCALDWSRPGDVVLLLVHSAAARAEVLAMLEERRQAESSDPPSPTVNLRQ